MIQAVLNNPQILPPEVYRRIVEKHKAGVLVEKKHKHKRQIANTNSWLETIQNYGALIGNIPSIILGGTTAPFSTNGPKSLVPEVRIFKGEKFEGAKRVKVRYGPFRVPSNQEKNFNYLMWNVEGTSTSFHINVRRPCDDECMILGIQAGLEYADGTPADTNTDIVFHHSVLLNVGPTIVEPTCGQPFIENIFMSGNEKSATDYAVPGGLKTGYLLNRHDTFLLNTELQNYSDQEKYVWETITYEVLDGKPAEMIHSKLVWLTVGTQENPSIALCNYFGGEFPWGPTNLTARDQPIVERFQEHSKIWRSDKEALILQAGGHLHDGGTSVDLYQNNEIFCKSDATYSTSAENAHGHGRLRSRYLQENPRDTVDLHARQLDGGTYDNTNIPHISAMKRCNFPQGRPLKPGDGLFISANYDLTRYRAVKDGQGKVDMVMGMGGVLIANKNL